MAGREGLVDTAVKTAETGYMQVRLELTAILFSDTSALRSCPRKSCGESLVSEEAAMFLFSNPPPTPIIKMSVRHDRSLLPRRWISNVVVSVELAKARHAEGKIQIWVTSPPDTVLCLEKRKQNDNLLFCFLTAAIGEVPGGSVLPVRPDGAKLHRRHHPVHLRRRRPGPGRHGGQG